MKRFVVKSFAVAGAGLLVFAAVALAWVAPKAKGIDCTAATFVVAAGHHESTPWLDAVYVNGSLVKFGTATDTATGSAAGTITVPLTGLLPQGGKKSHVKVTVNGPGGYSDGGSTVEADVTCGTVPTPPAPPVVTPAPPVTQSTPVLPPVATPPVTTTKRVAKCARVKRGGKTYIVCKKPTVCKVGRVHLVDSHGRHFTRCRTPKPPVVRSPKFTG